jgi:hypothetical protein
VIYDNDGDGKARERRRMISRMERKAVKFKRGTGNWDRQVTGGEVLSPLDKIM